MSAGVGAGVGAGFAEAAGGAGAPPAPPPGVEAPPATRRARAGRRERPAAFVVGNAAFILAALLVAAVPWALVHRTGWFGVTVAVALGAGTAVAWLGAMRRWSPAFLALMGLAAYLVLGLPAAAPTMLTDPARLLPGVVAIVTAPVTGWKNLVTLDLPLGNYQATLAASFVLLLACTIASLSLAWRAERLWGVAAGVVLVPLGLGIAFGSSATSDGAIVELAVGAAGVIITLAWLLWRTQSERRAALAGARRASGVRVTGRSRRTLVGRIGLASGMLVVALVAGVVIAPWATAGSTRDVLRTGVDPRLLLRSLPSPLADYRGWFDDAHFEQTQFTVAAPAGADRVRLAIMPTFDGEAMRTADGGADAGSDDAVSRFVRVPATREAAGGAPVSASVTIASYDGVWVPLVGELRSLSFEGSARASLADGFYVQPATGMGVQLANPGLRSGVQYRFDAAEAAAGPEIASLSPTRTGGSLPEALVPETMLAWIEAQGSPSGGAGLATLIERLRSRGFLSHALEVPGGESPLWLASLGGNGFESSRAGHGVERIDALFAALLEKQTDSGDADPALLVAAPGDDEQFATAAWLIADHLGFASRVVLGARLHSDEAALPVCDSGVCAGGDLAAWLEVQDAQGAWRAIDVSPQAALPIAPEVQDRRDPQNPTDVTPDRADTVQPPDPDAADSGARDDDDEAQPFDWEPILAALRAVGVSLLVLLVLTGPFLAVLAAKALRRRTRRTSPDPVDRVVGGWDEFVDAALDAGHELPRSATRTEIAGAVDPRALGHGGTLAVRADRAVFGAQGERRDESEEFWRLVDEARKALVRDHSFWARLRARFSVRSLTRGVGGRLARRAKGR